MRFKNIILSFIILFTTVFLSYEAHRTLNVFSSDTSISLPIIMYHSVVDNPDRIGKYVITPQKLEEDIRYLKDCGYSSISANQLIKYVYNNEPLPEKPIMITFDDGMYNNMKYALPILEKYGFSAIFSVVGSYTDEYTKSNIINPNYSYLRWSDIIKLSDSDYIEFGNHSYGFHSISKKRFGTQKNKGEKSLDYINAFYQDTEKLQSEFFSNCNYKPIIYTYPFGSYSKESAKVLKKMGFMLTLSCVEGINEISSDSDCLFMLKRYNRDGRLETWDFFKTILK